MQQENKILVWAVLILIISIVSFNFTGMTGEVTQNKITTMMLDRTYIMPGEIVNIKIIPGAKGVDQSIDIYRADTNVRYLQKAAYVCRSYKCSEVTTVEFKLVDNFEPGTYYFRVYDLYSKDYVKAYFTVGVKYQATGVEDHR